MEEERRLLENERREREEARKREQQWARQRAQDRSGERAPSFSLSLSRCCIAGFSLSARAPHCSSPTSSTVFDRLQTMSQSAHTHSQPRRVVELHLYVCHMYVCTHLRVSTHRTAVGIQPRSPTRPSEVRRGYGFGREGADPA